MSISAITPLGTNVQASDSLSQLSEDYDRFMTLLVAQIQHQDPLEPMDGTEFISQIATLTQVEQSVQTNSQLESLRSSLAIEGALYETALIGVSVTVPSDAIELTDEGAVFSYELADDSTGVTGIITDSQGKLVRRIEDMPGDGKKIHDIGWDGLDDQGNPVATGAYTISLSSDDEAGGYNTFMTSKVTSLEYLGGEKKLRLENGNLVESGSIVRAG